MCGHDHQQPISSCRQAREGVWAWPFFYPEWPFHTFPEEEMDGVYDHDHLAPSAMSPISLLRANEEWCNGQVGMGWKGGEGYGGPHLSQIRANKVSETQLEPKLCNSSGHDRTSLSKAGRVRKGDHSHTRSFRF